MSIILITGAATGIGNVTAKQLAQDGHTVYASMRDISGRNSDAAHALLALAERDNLRLHVVDLDVTSQQSADTAVKTVVDEQGRLDVVVQNAGHLYIGYVEAFTDEDITHLLDVNAVGAHRVNRAALPYLRRQRSGTLLYVGSTIIVTTPPFLGPYVASKAAFDALAVVTAYEAAQFGIDTCIVMPGALTQGHLALPERQPRLRHDRHRRILSLGPAGGPERASHRRPRQPRRGREPARHRRGNLPRACPPDRRQALPHRRRLHRRRRGARHGVLRHDPRSLRPPDGLRRNTRDTKMISITSPRVVLVPFQCLQHRVVATRDPPDPQPGHPVRLGHDVDRQRPFVQIGGLRQGPGRVQLETAIHLIGDQAYLAFSAQLNQFAPGVLARNSAGGVVREVDGDDPCSGPQRGTNLGEVQLPPRRFVQQDAGYLSACRQRDRFQCLIVGHGDDDVIPRSCKHLHRPENASSAPAKTRTSSELQLS